MDFLKRLFGRKQTNHDYYLNEFDRLTDRLKSLEERRLVRQEVRHGNRAEVIQSARRTRNDGWT